MFDGCSGSSWMPRKIPGNAISTIEATGRVSIQGLGSDVGRDATTVTRQVATMEAARLVLRRPDPSDGRVTLISLSQPGRRVMRTVQLARKKRVANLLRDWTDVDRRDLGRLLARFNDALTSHERLM